MSVVFRVDEDPPDELLLELRDEELLLEPPDEPLFLEELPEDPPPDELLFEEPLEELRLEPPEEREELLFELDELLLDFVFDSATLGHLGSSGLCVG
jgi:hypothetical protein